MSGSIAPRDLISTLDGDLLSGSLFSLFITWERTPISYEYGAGCATEIVWKLCSKEMSFSRPRM